MATKNEERMRWALEDVEKYIEQLEVARDTMASVTQMLMDTPGADDAVKASEGFVTLYSTVSKDLRRLTDRGLSRDS